MTCERFDFAGFFTQKLRVCSGNRTFCYQKSEVTSPTPAWTFLLVWPRKIRLKKTLVLISNHSLQSINSSESVLFHI